MKVYPKRIFPGIATGTDGRGAGAVVAAQRSGLLPRSFWAGAFSNTGIDVSCGARIDEPLQAGRMVLEIDAGDGAFFLMRMAAPPLPVMRRPRN